MTRLLVTLLLTLAAVGCRESIQTASEARRPAAAYPDYSGIVIPPNVAPLNLKILEPGRKFRLRISAGSAVPLEVASSDGVMRLPLARWRKLLESNLGGELRMDIHVKGENGWVHFDALRNRIAPDEVDPYVVYRYLPAVYNMWDRIRLRQRDLRGFEDRVLLDNQRSRDPAGQGVSSACINCHTFLNRDGNQFVFHMRPAQKTQIPAMILVRDGRAEMIDTRGGAGPPGAYVSWHPSGKLLAFSRNRLHQVFHTAGVETREVVDEASDLAVYNLETRRLQVVPEISRPDRLETFPSWSPDGRYLYFSSAPLLWPDGKNVPLLYDKLQYDMARIAYDPATGRWGAVETVVAASRLGRSISLAQVSPDGRYVMFCGHQYGSFPIYQPSSDLYLVDLNRNSALRELDEINSSRTDSYHSWSSNSRWVIFSSKREDGMFARFYLSHLEDGGRFSKPFLMPQEDPTFYGRCLMNFNRPEFVRTPVTVSPAELTRAMNVAKRSAADQGAAARSEGPWQPLR